MADMGTVREILEKAQGGTLYDFKETEEITAAVAEWALHHAADYNAAETFLRAVLDRIDCRAAFAPPGLIYTSELYRKIAAWGPEIQHCLDAYEEALGDRWVPETGDLQDYVWFAVEWVSYELAAFIRSAVEGSDDA